MACHLFQLSARFCDFSSTFEWFNANVLKAYILGSHYIFLLGKCYLKGSQNVQTGEPFFTSYLERHIFGN
jgi:hypothetical protein